MMMAFPIAARIGTLQVEFEATEVKKGSPMEMQMGRSLQTVQRAAMDLPHLEFQVLEPEVWYHRSDPLD